MRRVDSRTVVLWTPLVIGFWIAIGIRQSFFVPTEHQRANTNRNESAVTGWVVARAGRLYYRNPSLLDLIGRHAARRLTESPEDPDPDLSSTTVLDLSGALQSHAGR